jgi:hypothetical protein
MLPPPRWGAFPAWWRRLAIGGEWERLGAEVHVEDVTPQNSQRLKLQNGSYALDLIVIC